MATAPKEQPKVSIYIPRMEEAGVGARVDQTEHVTINGKTTIIQRGVHVDVPIDVFAVLKVKYPEL
jgi:hypothetical protein